MNACSCAREFDTPEGLTRHLYWNPEHHRPGPLSARAAWEALLAADGDTRKQALEDFADALKRTNVTVLA